MWKSEEKTVFQAESIDKHKGLEVLDAWGARKQQGCQCGQKRVNKVGVWEEKWSVREHAARKFRVL